MPPKTMTNHGALTCAVEVSPIEVDAGAKFTVTARVACPHGCDLSGQSISIEDQEGAELARAELSNGEMCAVLTAPLAVGEHSWRLVLPAHEAQGIMHEESAHAFSFIAKPHAANVHVWSVPSAI